MVQNVPAKNIPYFTPAQIPPAGTATATAGESLPTLFKPLKLRSLTLPHRIAVSPMCMYSAEDGSLTDFHLVHLGQFALHGAALTIVEATGVLANGRISPEDSGLWKDGQIAPLKRIADFVHSQGQLLGIQLAHAGRKASTRAPWIVKVEGRSEVATAEEGGWEANGGVWGPSAIKWGEGHAEPAEMTLDQIKEVTEAFIEAAKRATKAGVDVIEIHGAHGYLINEFLSPLSNHRTDAYGGSFENRTRLLTNVIKGIRAVIPDGMPLLVRLSATEWMEWAGEPSWDVNETIKLARLLPSLGVDMLDVSSGGNNDKQKVKQHDRYYQVSLAQQIRATLRKEGIPLLIASVGLITDAEMAKGIVQEDAKVANSESNGDAGDDGVSIEDEQGLPASADLVLAARQFLREPEWVLRSAHQLGVQVKWPNQYHRAPWRKDVRL